MAGSPPPSQTPLYVFSGGFLTGRRIRRILELGGWTVRIGVPGDADWIGVWGRTPVSQRGSAVAERTGAGVLTVEDPFLRSLFPGREGEPPFGLLLDRSSVHFDPAVPSDLETLLATHPLDDAHLLDRGRQALERIKRSHLTKYAAVDTDIAPPEPGYVLVIDQTLEDASVVASGADRTRFLEMLTFAQEENPGADIVIKTHPETVAGHRNGYFRESDTNDRIRFLTEPVSPWLLLDGAVAVYTVSSTMGFEAILAGHRPRVFGQPFYCGWGLTVDEYPVARRERSLTRAQLFAATMILYPIWYDPYRDRVGSLEDVIGGLEAQARAWREDRLGYVASGMRLWKRPHIQRFFGRHAPVRFRNEARAVDDANRHGCPLLTWASKTTPPKAARAIRVEDGFLRSRGLGARLVPPLSLVRDDLGIYYDPNQECRLDRTISSSVALTDAERARARRLIASLTASGLSKYNTGSAEPPDLPDGHRILIPGQVEDDASVLRGCNGIATNGGLLRTARKARPDAVLVYKPHPDVEAGLRHGVVTSDDLECADVVLTEVSAHAALAEMHEVWTLTSTIGFEALLRGLPVTCLGMPFYAGWGLTIDLVDAPVWRTAKPDIVALAHAVLVDYPRYFDPVTGLACPVEVVVERLVEDSTGDFSRVHRTLAKLQGLKASFRGSKRR